jgi:hypothetical protein
MNPERRLVPLSGVKTQPIVWLWPNRIPKGAITVLEGDPERAKSAITYDLGARVTRGRPMPNCDRAIPAAGVVLIQGEDSLCGTVRPALAACGADISRVYVYDASRFAGQPLTLPADLQLLEVAVGEVQARLVVLDPITAFLGGSANSDAGVRKALGPLATFAERAGVAVVLVRHLRKDGSRNPLHRGAGSIAITGVARSVLVVGPEPGAAEPHRFMLAQAKGNLSRAVSLLYRTTKTGDTVSIEWLGESQHTAQDLAAQAAERSALDEACYVLYSLLSQGPVWVKEVYPLAAQEGVARRTLYRAKEVLGVASRKRGNGKRSCWLWELPDDEILLRRYRERDLDELSHRLFHGGEDPPLPGDGWKSGQPEDWAGEDDEDGVPP